MGIAKTLMIVGATAVVAVAVTAGVAAMLKRRERVLNEDTTNTPRNTSEPVALKGSGIRVTSIPRLSIARRQTPQQETPTTDSGMTTDGPPPSGVVVRGTAVNGPVYGTPVTDGMRPASAHLPGLNLY